MSDARVHSPSAERNKAPIGDVLRTALPQVGTVLEIASGTGQHAAWLSSAMPGLRYYPTEANPSLLDSIDAYRDEGGPLLQRARYLDVRESEWGVPEPVDAIICSNMIHISPWASTLGLMSGAATTLVGGGLLYLYGPFQRSGVFEAPSNARFDESLRARNPAWGVRDLDEVVRIGERHGLDLEQTVRMPANNLSVLFRKR